LGRKDGAFIALALIYWREQGRRIVPLRHRSNAGGCNFIWLFFFADLAFLLGSFLFAGSLRLGTPLATNAHRQAMLFVPLFAVLALYNRSCSVRTLTDRGYFVGLLLAADFGGIHLVLYLLRQGIGPVFAVHLDVGNIAVVRADDPVPFVDLPLHWQALGVASQNILVIENDGPAVDIAQPIVSMPAAGSFSWMGPIRARLTRSADVSRIWKVIASPHFSHYRVVYGGLIT